MGINIKKHIFLNIKIYGIMEIMLKEKKSGGYIIYGRSDATLNPGGVSLGTAEIYSVIEKINEIKECIVVGQAWDNDVRIILFVVLNKSLFINKRFIR